MNKAPPERKVACRVARSEPPLADGWIALTTGTDADVRRGDTVHLVEGAPLPVVDPDTEELLGVYERWSVVVYVVRAVYPRFSVARRATDGPGPDPRPGADAVVVG